MRGIFFSLSSLALATTLAPVLAADYVVENYAIEQPLTTIVGDPARGQAVMIDREGGNCLGCHAVPVAAEFFGTTGPTLAGVGARLSPAQIRLRLVDPKQVNPMTMMPAYYKRDGLHRVRADFAGKAVLTAQQIEDIVAFLASLK